MTKFRISMDVEQDELLGMIRAGAVRGANITPIPDEAGETVHQLRPAAPKQRAQRGSKVNDAILGALADGSQSTKELKAALVKAGLAAGSLSTGLALLQKSGQVERVDGGFGLVPLQKAAE